MPRLAVCVLIAGLSAGCGPARSAAAGPRDATALAAAYRSFLDGARTPADAVDLALAGAPGFVRVDLVDGPARRTRPGDRLAFVDRGRAAVFAVVGAEPLARAGARVIATHLDTPSPVLRADALGGRDEVELRAGGYGAIKAFHWAGIPLALVGRVARAGGGVEVAVRLGLDGDGFSFAVRAVDGRTLAAVAASTGGGEGERPGAVLLRALRARYGLTAADLEAAELYLVPAGPARAVGLDRALIGGHGQDDRANSYLAWRAVADLGATPRRTALIWLTDREETGARGPTGAESRFLEHVYAYLLAGEGAPASEAALARALAASRALSADTPPALDPSWPEVHEARHAPRLGGGPALFPFTGRGGKVGGSGAGAELIAEVVTLCESLGVPLQLGELGAVDAGGGGTIAADLASRGLDVVDIGVPVLGMHSPFELTAVADLWWTYAVFRAWLEAA